MDKLIPLGTSGATITCGKANFEMVDMLNCSKCKYRYKGNFSMLFCTWKIDFNKYLDNKKSP